MAVITISRQIGAGGEQIAKSICDLLRYRYFDKQIMINTAAELGLAKDHVIDYSEEQYEVKTFVSRLLRPGPRPIKTFAVRAQDSKGNVTLTEETIDEEQYVTLIQSAIRSAYDLDDIVIVGRGGQAVLQDKPNVLHVRIIAPTGSRIERIQQQYALSIEQAQQRINRQDRATAEYLGRFFGVRCDDPTLYHLLINTGKTGIDAAVQLILDATVQLRAMPVT
ncbi:MAG: cytidylate kinase-like family protein [Anaerolineae bacterium]|nr:cytidylate kinase-like family protein [Anaerolineae bacterium]